MPYELLLAAGLVFATDQWSKTLVVRRLGQGRSVPVVPGLRLRRVNGSRGIRRGAGRPMTSVGLWMMSFVAILAFIQFGGMFPHPPGQAGLGAALGGAAGNLWDRWRRGAVVDFFDLGWWPVFNVADAAITVGIPLALWFIH